MKIVVKIGGSIAINGSGMDAEYFSRFLPVLKEIEKRNDVSLCIGGGKIVRNYFASAKKLGLSDENMEKVAIEIIRAHVLFLSSLTGKSPVLSLGDVHSGNMVIGGLMPGRSTDANAALLASLIKADMLVKMTDVDGIYDNDPKKFHGAKLIRAMDYGTLMAFSKPGTPGNYGILDSQAIEIIAKHRIMTVIVNGKNPENLYDALALKTGTLIR
ncbi:MAG: hypothetical protein HY365_00095 [Candidatus Aenigmarchaeota archaeon]|nr:hypothetical protein [Candidatus Aenigmarchaeota archaeon]